MIVAVPVTTPVTIPLPEPTAAIAALLLLHVPAPDTSPSVIVEPAHTGLFPVIAPGALVTETIVVAMQPDDAL